MKREIIESIIKHGDKKLNALKYKETLSVRYVGLMSEYLKGLGRFRGIREDFNLHNTQPYDYGVAHVTWWPVDDPNERKIIKRVLRRLMARHWVKIGRKRKKNGQNETVSGRKLGWWHTWFSLAN